MSSYPLYESNPGPEVVPMSQLGAVELYDIAMKTFTYFKDTSSKDAMGVPVHEMRTEKKLFRKTQQDYSTYAHYKAEFALTRQAKYAVGFHKDIYMKTIAIEQTISDEAYTYATPRDGWDEFKAKIRNLAILPSNRLNLDITHAFFTFAQSTSYVDQDGQIIDIATGDGLSPANAAHLLAHSPITYSNIGVPVLFSKAAWKINERVNRYNTLDNFGMPYEGRLTHIWFTGDAENKEEIYQFLKSRSDNTQNNPEVVNTFFGKLQPLELSKVDSDIYGHFDTSKSNWWGGIGLSGNILDGSRFSGILGVWEYPRLKSAPYAGGPGGSFVDFSRDVLKWASRARYGIGMLDGMQITYNFPTNS